MSALGTKLRRLAGGKLAFWCPGCDSAHAITVGAGPGPTWTWDDNVEAPTFAPSILVRWHEADISHVCHCFVTSGTIQFLADCTHHLAGRTVPLPAFD